MALDLRSGKILWRGLAGINPLFSCGASDQRNAFVLTANGKAWELDARTGRILWQAVDGDDVVSVVGDVAVFSSVSNHMTFRSLADMSILDPASPSGGDALRQAVRVSGRALVQTRGPGFVSLATGGYVPIPIVWQERAEGGIRVITIGSRAVANVDTDDGGMGHSVWPKYLMAYNADGKFVWRFPAKPVRDMSETSIRMNIQGMCPIHQSNVITAWDSGGRLYGLDAVSGRKLWARKVGVGVGAHAASGRNFVFQARVQRDGHTTIQTQCVDGRTGRTAVLADFPEAMEMVARDGHLLLLSRDGRLLMYRLKLHRQP